MDLRSSYGTYVKHQSHTSPQLNWVVQSRLQQIERLRIFHAIDTHKVVRIPSQVIRCLLITGSDVQSPVRLLRQVMSLSKFAVCFWGFPCLVELREIYLKGWHYPVSKAKNHFPSSLANLILAAEYHFLGPHGREC